MPKPAARKGDPHDCSKDIHDGGEIVEGSPNINIEGLPAARVGDAAKCENGGDNLIQKGSATVFFNDKPAARVDDDLDHGGVVVAGASNVFIGSGGGNVIFGSKGKIEIGGKGKVIIGGRSAAANHAPEISCPIAINEIQKETDEIANMTDKVARNKKITATYIKLYQENPNLEWAHTALYASKQVGCALKHSYALGGKDDTILGKIGKKGMELLIIDALAEGNKAVFKDVYPMLKFYNKYSLTKIKECYPEKSPSEENIYQALEKVDKGDVDKGAKIILEHEQKNILQKMYEKFIFSVMTRLNHAGGVATQTFNQATSIVQLTSAIATPFVQNKFFKEIINDVIYLDTVADEAFTNTIASWIQPEKVSLSSDCSGGVEHDMSDIDIRDAKQRIKSAEKLMQLVKKNGYENYSVERNHFNKLLVSAEE